MYGVPLWGGRKEEREREREREKGGGPLLETIRLLENIEVLQKRGHIGVTSSAHLYNYINLLTIKET